MGKSAQHFSGLSDKAGIGTQGGLEPRSPHSPQTDARKGPIGVRLLLLFIKGLAHTHSRQRHCSFQLSNWSVLFPSTTDFTASSLSSSAIFHSGPPDISTWISNRNLDMPNWTLDFPAQMASSTVVSIFETVTPYYQAKILRVLLDSTHLSPLIHQQRLWLYKWECATPSFEYPHY